jgi:hypothetical protein
MIDDTLKEIHRIKDSNGKRYPSVTSLARALIVKERESRNQGKRFVGQPVKPVSKVASSAPKTVKS